VLSAEFTADKVLGSSAEGEHPVKPITISPPTAVSLFMISPHAQLPVCNLRLAQSHAGALEIRGPINRP
jgi:hypothetical protein